MEGLKKLFLPITSTINYIQNHFKAMLFLLLLFLLFYPSGKDSIETTNLQHIKLYGPIMDVTQTLEQLNKAYDSDNIKGVLFEVSSPGGAVSPSIELMYALKRLKEKKPVVVYASGTMASGSYYASIYADKIIANPGSMVGSIGVIMQGTNLSEIMKKVGISTQTVSAGKYKQLGTSSREWLPFEKDELNKVIQGTYKMFVSDVAKARKLDVKDAPKFANAHIFTASQAKDIGLVDELGVMYDAKKELVKMSEVKTPIWSKEDKFDKFIKKLTQSTSLLLNSYFSTSLQAKL